MEIIIYVAIIIPNSNIKAVLKSMLYFLTCNTIWPAEVAIISGEKIKDIIAPTTSEMKALIGLLRENNSMAKALTICFLSHIPRSLQRLWVFLLLLLMMLSKPLNC